MLELTTTPPASQCVRCGTELAAAARACPRCAALVHRERLEDLAARATAAEAAGERASARMLWEETRDLLPVASQQYTQVQERIGALSEALEHPPSAGTPAQRGARPWGMRAFGLLATIALLFAGKLKFLLLGLSKLGTVTSLFGFIAVYWSIHGWPLAVGLAGSIYVHEMGHVAMLRRLGIQAGAPLFIPGVGALVMLKEHVTDPVKDARIGLAGPVWGLGAAVAAGLTYLMTGAPIWLAIAELTGFLNLFNLLPVWQLDGARGFHALSRVERWAIVGVIGMALLAFDVRLLWIVGAVAAYRAWRSAPGPGHAPTFATFAGLVLALSWFARSVR